MNAYLIRLPQKKATCAGYHTTTKHTSKVKATWKTKKTATTTASLGTACNIQKCYLSKKKNLLLKLETVGSDPALGSPGCTERGLWHDWNICNFPNIWKHDLKHAWKPLFLGGWWGWGAVEGLQGAAEQLNSSNTRLPKTCERKTPCWKAPFWVHSQVYLRKVGESTMFIHQHVNLCHLCINMSCLYHVDLHVQSHVMSCNIFRFTCYNHVLSLPGHCLLQRPAWNSGDEELE